MIVPEVPPGIPESVFSLDRSLPVPSNDSLNTEFSGVCSFWIPVVVTTDQFYSMATGSMKECSICKFKSIFLNKYACKQEDSACFAEMILP